MAAKEVDVVGDYRVYAARLAPEMIDLTKRTCPIDIDEFSDANELPEGLLTHLGQTDFVGGSIITALEEGLAAKSGLNVGDVILSGSVGAWKVMPFRKSTLCLPCTLMVARMDSVENEAEMTVDVEKAAEMTVDIAPETTKKQIDPAWMDYYEQLLQFYRQRGHTVVPSSGHLAKLAAWTTEQKQQTEDQLTDEQTQLLSAVSICLSKSPSSSSSSSSYSPAHRNDSNWNQKLDLLLAFQKEHGHLYVPFTHKTKDGFGLGRWVLNQRTLHKENRLPRERYLKLQEMGFVWSVRDDPDSNVVWNEKFRLLTKFKETFGHVNVTSKYEMDGVQLGQWVANQRAAYKRDAMPRHRIEKLEGIGISWRIRHSSDVQSVASQDSSMDEPSPRSDAAADKKQVPLTTTSSQEEEEEVSNPDAEDRDVVVQRALSNESDESRNQSNVIQVGSRVQIWWEEHRAYHYGTIEDQRGSKYLVQYERGGNEWVDLRYEKVSLVDDSGTVKDVASTVDDDNDDDKESVDVATKSMLALQGAAVCPPTKSSTVTNTTAESSSKRQTPTPSLTNAAVEKDEPASKRQRVVSSEEAEKPVAVATAPPPAAIDNTIMSNPQSLQQALALIQACTAQMSGDRMTMEQEISRLKEENGLLTKENGLLMQRNVELRESLEQSERGRAETEQKQIKSTNDVETLALACREKDAYIEELQNIIRTEAERCRLQYESFTRWTQKKP